MDRESNSLGNDREGINRGSNQVSQKKQELNRTD